MKKITRFIPILIFLAFGIAFVVLTSDTIRQNLGIGDSSALYGGELERGYPSAGYLISYGVNGSIQTCGFTVLNDKVAVSASHCVDGSKEIFLGKRDFSFNNEKNIKVTKATQREGWVKNKERASDFSILEFNDTAGYFKDFATIGTPTAGCNYRVVAYGRTEDPSESFTKPRKSAVVCASEIKNDTFFIHGEKSGICFGDSGSPVYENNTNKLVGVVASIILEESNETQPCEIGNNAIVVRVDANQRLVNEILAEIGGEAIGSTTGSSVTDPGGSLETDVVKENFIDRLGISNLSNRQRFNLLVGVSGTVLVTLVILLVYVLSRSSKHKDYDF